MDIHEKAVDMDADMDGKFHIHGKPGYRIAQCACAHRSFAGANCI